MFLWAILILQLCMLSPSCKAAADNEGAILVLGDSWASASQDFLGGVCGLVQNEAGAFDTESRPVTNNGIAGSTAAGWASSGKAKNAFKNAKYEYAYVWLSIGGNDFKCGESDSNSEISENILKVIEEVIDSSSNENLQILYTGYGYPSEEQCGGRTAPFDDLNSIISQAIQNSSYSEKVKYIDIASKFVTPESSPFSDKQWYADDIHINESGYIKLFSMPAVQEFFGCTSTAGPVSPPSSDGPSRLSSSGGIATPMLKFLLISILSMYYTF